MELYKLIATVNNYSSTLATSISGSVDHIDLTSAATFPSAGAVRIGTKIFIYTSKTGNTLNGELQVMGIISAGAEVVFTFIFAFIPENFEGVTISQQFSFVNPIGYTPKFSIDTMRTLNADKWAIDDVFLAYGLESDVSIEIQKLNALGIAYEIIQSFAIDFESYEISDYYSEFALKSISVIDYYNNIKNTEKQVELGGFHGVSAPFPTTQKFINYVSLKSKGVRHEDAQNAVFQFNENNQSKIYNSDTSLTDTNHEIVYSIGSLQSETLFVSMTGSIKLNCTVPGAVVISFFITGGSSSDYFGGQALTLVSGINVIDISQDEYGYTGTITTDKTIYVIIESDTSAAFDLEPYEQLLFIDIKRQTDISVIGSANEKINYRRIDDLLANIFNDNITIPFSEPIFSYGLTSANQIQKTSNFANIKPKEFLYDLCIAGGLMLNFKKNGGVVIGNIGNMLNALFEVDIDDVPINSLAITDFKDLSVRYNMQLNFASVAAGQEISEYDIYSYFLDWNKILTFLQSERNAIENLDLTLTKFRTDFSGMLDYFYKRSKQIQKTSKDNFIFDPLFEAVRNDITQFVFYDNFTPRDILINWEKYLSFCFQNFSKNTLVINSNGGNEDNLLIDTVNQMDNITLNSTPRLLPIEYNFTAIIGDVDFSEKILKINHEDEDVYLFVINAETMDNFSEQKIKGLKIQF